MILKFFIVASNNKVKDSIFKIESTVSIFALHSFRKVAGKALRKS